MSFLAGLGIAADVRAFFGPFLMEDHSGVRFLYGGDFEHAGKGFHRIPVTENIWVAGACAVAAELVIGSSAMDLIAWINIYRSRYNYIDSLGFISVGAVPFPVHAEVIRPLLRSRKLHFVFSGDPSGRLCDLKMMSYLIGMPLAVSFSDHAFSVVFKHHTYRMRHLSLNALEKACRRNFRIRTHKPRKGLSFYEQLLL